MVEEVGRMFSIFADYESSEYKDMVDLGRWSTDVITSMQGKVMNYAGKAAAQIKDELIGDGDEAKFLGRLKTAFFELGADSNFAPSYFPCFDEVLFELPNKDYSGRNRATLEALAAVYGSEREAADVMTRLEAIARWANVMVQDVAKMFDEVCSFVGYIPEHEEKQEPKQKDLHYYCRKAIEKGYLRKTDTGYKRNKDKLKKAQLAYFLRNFPNPDGTFPDAEYSILFGESRLGKAASQLPNNKYRDGKPRGYELIDELMEL